MALTRGQALALKDVIQAHGIHCFASNMDALWVSAFDENPARLIDSVDTAVEMLVLEFGYGDDVRKELEKL